MSQTLAALNVQNQNDPPRKRHQLIHSLPNQTLRLSQTDNVIVIHSITTHLMSSLTALIDQLHVPPHVIHLYSQRNNLIQPDSGLTYIPNMITHHKNSPHSFLFHHPISLEIRMQDTNYYLPIA